jgi:hypothetical protein
LHASCLTPKFLETQKGLFGVWAPCKKNILFYFSFLINEWTRCFTRYLATPSMSNSNSMWAHDEFLLKMDCKFIYLVFFEELLYCLRVEGQSAKNKVCFAHRILDIQFLWDCFFAHGSIWWTLSHTCPIWFRSGVQKIQKKKKTIWF